MKTSKRNKLLGLALTGSLSLLSASNVLAAAGVPIANTATLNFDVGGTGQTPIDASTSFVEDRAINFTVVREGGTVNVAPNAAGQAIPFLVGNTGNGTHGFLLAGVHNLGALDPHGSGNPDVFTPAIAPLYKTYVDTNNNGALDPGEIADTNSYIPTLAPGGTTRVFVVAGIPADSRVPAPLANGDVAVISLVAHASVDGTSGIIADAIISDDNANNSPGGTFNGAAAPIIIPAGTVVVETPDGVATMETVFNDAAFTDGTTGITVDATGGNDTDQNAQQSSYSSYTVLTAILTVTKASVALWDPLNLDSNPKAIPNGYVQYTISVANAAGAADADLTILTDILPASLDLDPDFITGVGASPLPTSAFGDSIQVSKGGAPIYCTGSTADTDGCGYTGGAGGTVTVDLSNATFVTLMPLAAGETVDLKFNVIVQ